MATTEQTLDHIFAHLRSVESAESLADFTEKMVGQLLRRDEDVTLRDKTLARVRTFFASPAGQVMSGEAREFAAEVVSIIMQIRRGRGVTQMSAEEIDGVYASLGDDSAGQVRGQATEPTRIVVIPPPHAETDPTFEKLFAAALRHKVGLTLTFFQRWNPRVYRRMPAPFMLSTTFGGALDKVIDERIAPLMLDSRTMRHIGTLYRWAELDSVSFWKVAEEGGHVGAIHQAWHLAWDKFRPQRVKQKTSGGEKEVLRAGPDLLWLRDKLASERYALPEIRSREIELFASFLEPDSPREDLEKTWTRLRQLYEQELDQRFYQDKARAGALRDSLLDCFRPHSPRTAEFLSLLCYRNFPYLSLSFLEIFTHNHGSNEEVRKKNIPILMWYLGLPDAAAALEADERWIAESAARDETKVRDEAEQEEKQRLKEMGAVVWKMH